MANRIAWKLYSNNIYLEYAEQLSKQSLALCYSTATLQTFVAILVRSGKWDEADSHFRRYIREEPISKIVGGGSWREDILLYRDAIKAGHEQWIATRIRDEAPEPRDQRWDVICYALIGGAGEWPHLQQPITVVAEQFRSDEPNPVFPPL